MRVFMWTAGTSGLCGWATRLMPVAKKRGSSAAPGIWARNSGENSPETVETLTPTFSNTRPCIRLITPPPPSEPSVGGTAPGAAGEAAGFAVRERAGCLFVLDGLERRADAVAQAFEPGAGDGFECGVRRVRGAVWVSMPAI